MKNVKIVSYGIGVIGQRLAKYLLTKEGIEIVGAIDINPAILGKDLGAVLGQKKIGVTISDDVEMLYFHNSPYFFSSITALPISHPPKTRMTYK